MSRALQRVGSIRLLGGSRAYTTVSTNPVSAARIAEVLAFRAAVARKCLVFERRNQT
jgi:hypothetical protein